MPILRQECPPSRITVATFDNSQGTTVQLHRVVVIVAPTATGLPPKRSKHKLPRAPTAGSLSIFSRGEPVVASGTRNHTNAVPVVGSVTRQLSMVNPVQFTPQMRPPQATHLDKYRCCLPVNNLPRPNLTLKPRLLQPTSQTVNPMSAILPLTLPQTRSTYHMFRPQVLIRTSHQTYSTKPTLIPQSLIH